MRGYPASRRAIVVPARTYDTPPWTERCDASSSAQASASLPGARPIGDFAERNGRSGRAGPRRCRCSPRRRVRGRRTLRRYDVVAAVGGDRSGGVDSFTNCTRSATWSPRSPSGGGSPRPPPRGGAAARVGDGPCSHLGTGDRKGLASFRCAARKHPGPRSGVRCGSSPTSSFGLIDIDIRVASSLFGGLSPSDTWSLRSLSGSSSVPSSSSTRAAREASKRGLLPSGDRWLSPPRSARADGTLAATREIVERRPVAPLAHVTVVEAEVTLLRASFGEEYAKAQRRVAAGCAVDGICGLLLRRRSPRPRGASSSHAPTSVRGWSPRASARATRPW
jgi:hypothetical protein